MQRDRKTELRVGVFVITALIVGATLIFTIGSRRNMFGSKVTYHAVFSNVSGLRAGSPVRIAGVDVGVVSDVTIRRDGKIHVELRVDDDATPLVRRGSLASIGNKGLLGDKLVEVSVGDGPPLPAETTLGVDESADFGAYMRQAGKVLASAQETVDNLRATTEGFADPQFGADVRRATRRFADVMDVVADERGPMRRLMSDPELATRVQSSLANVDRATGELASTARSVRAIADEVRSGDGTAHELIYGRSGAELAQNLANATGEVTQILEEVRTGDGTLHAIVYDDAGREIVANATAMSADLRAIVGDIRAGRGTIGGLLADPSIYEDVKRLVGNLERNEVLRALVRYSIRNDAPREGARATPTD